MKYIDLGEALQIAEASFGIDANTMRFISNTEILESALYSPQIGYGDVDVYGTFEEQAAVLASRIMRNHPLLDGNKRFAWAILTLFCLKNGVILDTDTAQVIALFVLIASGEATEHELADWIGRRQMR